MTNIVNIRHVDKKCFYFGNLDENCGEEKHEPAAKNNVEEYAKNPQ